MAAAFLDDDFLLSGEIARELFHGVAELFRRILCDAIGRDVEAGRIVDDRWLLSEIVRDVCMANAVRFFGLEPLAEAT
jgi:glucuronate isomerase